MNLLDLQLTVGFCFWFPYMLIIIIYYYKKTVIRIKILYRDLTWRKSIICMCVLIFNFLTLKINWIDFFACYVWLINNASTFQHERSSSRKPKLINILNFNPANWLRDHFQMFVHIFISPIAVVVFVFLANLLLIS